MNKLTEKLAGIFFFLLGTIGFLYPGIWLVVHEPTNILGYIWTAMGPAFFLFAYELYTGKYKIKNEYKDYGLTCSKCGQTAALFSPTRGNAHMRKVKYDDKCPYCRK